MKLLKGILPGVFGAASPDEPAELEQTYEAQRAASRLQQDRRELLIAQAEQFIQDFTSRENWTNATIQKRLRELSAQNVDHNGVAHDITVQELAQMAVYEMGRTSKMPMFSSENMPVVFSEEYRAAFEELGANVPERMTFDAGLPAKERGNITNQGHRIPEREEISVIYSGPRYDFDKI